MVELNANTSPHIDDWIALYLTGEATSEQRAQVEQWCRESLTNQKYFDAMKLIFEKTAASTAVDFDTDRAWKTLRKKLGRVDEPRVLVSPNYRAWLRLAAGVIVLITAGVFAYRYVDSVGIKTVAFSTNNTVDADTLPDGTSVFMNRESTIRYRFNPKKQTHTVQLEGEAYFTIHHDAAKVFVVAVEGMFIRDIGTAFNVTAYPDSMTVEVAVEEGAVVLYNAAGDSLYVTKGRRGIFDKMTKVFSIAGPEPNTTAYKTKFFSFTNQSLTTVVQTLNSVYREQIHIDASLADCKLTASFRDEHPAEIAAIIAETLGLTVTRNENIINLKGPGCGTTAL